jgi:hypothetical protein
MMTGITLIISLNNTSILRESLIMFFSVSLRNSSESLKSMVHADINFVSEKISS